MIRRLGLTLALGLIVSGVGVPGSALVAGNTGPAGKTGKTGKTADVGETAAAATVAVTHTGWFSDAACAAPRVKRGIIAPNNPDCVKRCLDEGKAAVFVSEQAKALFEVKDYTSVKDDVGWYIELTGTIDAEAKTIAVQSVKRLEYVGAQCALPKKTPPKKAQPARTESDD